MEKFAIGLALGMIGGALLTANNCKMRMLVKKGQDEVREKLNDLMDEKLRDMENCNCGCGDSGTERDSEEKPKKSVGTKKADSTARE